MTTEEKNRWLVENVLKECWHEWTTQIGGNCKYCGKTGEEVNFEYNPDFYSSNPDTQAINFFRLFNAIKNKEWFAEFVGSENYIRLRLMSCSALADAIGEYWSWRKVE